MKKIFFLSTLFLSLTLQAQTILKPGIYKSEGENQGIELKVNNDETYQMVFLSGKLNSKNDSIYFENKNKKESKFIVNQFENNKNSSAIVVTVNPKYIAYYYNPVYIGTQKNDKSPIEYNLIRDYNVNEEAAYDENEEKQDIVFSLDRVKYIYLVEEKDGIATSSKYEIKDSVSNLEILYAPYAVSNISLRGFVNENNKLVITDGGLPITFSLNSENSEISLSDLKPLSTKNDLDFVAPISKNQSEDNYYDDYQNNNFDFKFVIDSNLKDALKTIQKTPSKFLVVSYNPNNKNDKTEFDTFIKTQENNVKSSMYDKYQPEYDLYNFYLASSKDKNLFDSNIKEPQIVVLNTNGDKLYNTTGTLSENQDLFIYYSQLSVKLSKAKVYLELDKQVNNKKASISDLKAAFKSSLKIDTPYIDSYEEEVVETDTNENEVKWSTDAVDSTAVEVYEEYDKLKDEQNLYTFKTSKELLNTKWKQVLEYYKKQSVVDEDLVSIIKKEISNDGFTIKLFKEKKELLSDLDFEGVDYLLNNYDAILQLEGKDINESFATVQAAEVVETVEVVSDYEYDYYNRNVDEVLLDVFTTNTNSYFNVDKAHFDKTLAYFKKYVAKSNENPTVFISYLNSLVNNTNMLTNRKELYSSFENYFNQLTSQSTSLIESLDIVFTRKSENSYDNDWFSFKNSFSNLSNSIAWSVVENEKDSALIKKAIKWSETSLKISKDNGYYLDTLAQLYYKDGQKELAIKTQKQALEAMKEYQESDTYIEMQDVLNKMKNGTY